MATFVHALTKWTCLLSRSSASPAAVSLLGTLNSSECPESRAAARSTWSRVLSRESVTGGGFSASEMHPRTVWQARRRKVRLTACQFDCTLQSSVSSRTETVPPSCLVGSVAVEIGSKVLSRQCCCHLRSVVPQQTWTCSQVDVTVVRVAEWDAAGVAS